MAKQVLTTLEHTINQLKKFIVGKRYVNCYSREFSLENQQQLEQFLAKLKEAYKDIIYVDIDIREFAGCMNEEQEVKILLDLISRELTEKGISNIHLQAISIASALFKWSNGLNQQVLLVFRFFHDLYSEKEKNILRSLRKILRNRDQLNSYLGILIVSNRNVAKWELFPESNLDERHLAFFDFESTKVG
jgi:hypothetical protein